MSNLPGISIIIPCYKAQDTILRTLCSIAEQEIVEDFEVILVNDADEEGYQKFVDMFSPYYNLREIKREVNGGPGDSRQTGIEAATQPLITFIDADDTFSGRFALKTLRNQMLSDPSIVCVFSRFLEDQKVSYLVHQEENPWMFGKLYKKDYLINHNIRFPINSRSNEDGAFNTLCKLYSSESEKIKYIQDISYYWNYREDSITRKDNCDYSYNGSFKGLVENQIWVIKEAEKNIPFSEQLNKHKIDMMINLFVYYLESCRSGKKYMNQNHDLCTLFYKEVYRDIQDKIPSKLLVERYNEIMKNNYGANKLKGIIPIGFIDFLKELEGDLKNGRFNK